MMQIRGFLIFELNRNMTIKKKKIYSSCILRISKKCKFGGYGGLPKWKTPNGGSTHPHSSVIKYRRASKLET